VTVTICDVGPRDGLQNEERRLDPEFGPYIGPGIVPKLTRTPGAVRWSATWDEGSHNQEVYGELLGLGEDELAELREEGVL